MFIFDEMAKMPLGLINVLKPYLDHYPDVGKVDFRRSIFIFLSNTGGHLINNAILEHWKDGKKREDIGIKQMDKIINYACVANEILKWVGCVRRGVQSSELSVGV